MSSEIKLRRSPRLNKESDSEPEESDYCDYVEIFDNNVDFITNLTDCFGIIPVLYSLYNGFYIHTIVSGSIVFFGNYPDFSIMDYNASTVSYQIGLVVYLTSQFFIMNHNNLYIIIPLEIGAQYCFLFHTILYLRNDKRHVLFKGFMNFLICVAKCAILYYLTN
jgi:hypothetical protein